jgi:maleylpyruvate isomerase
MTAPQYEDAVEWWTAGERTVADHVERLTDGALSAPSALPDWLRAHVVAHIARNADALVNLLDWARTGIETPMYPSREVRNAGIDQTAGLAPADLKADYAAACKRFADAVANMPAEAWSATLRNMQGGEIPATAVPWMRAKEVWVHGVDLAAGLTFADAPPDFCAALVDDVLATFAARGEAPEVALEATDLGRAWGSGTAQVIGPVSAIAAWLTRSDDSGLTGPVPQAPRWL